MVPLKSHSEEGDRWWGVPLAAMGQHQPGVVLFAATAKIFTGKWDLDKVEGRRRVEAKAPPPS